jgi:integrase/recombinase XerD
MVTAAMQLLQRGVDRSVIALWLGHESIETTINMTMRYLHHVEEHYRSLPEQIAEAGKGALNPDQRVLVMLAARTAIAHGNSMAKPGDDAWKCSVISTG